MVLQKNKDSQNKIHWKYFITQNHWSKNIIICQKITKQSKQNSYTSLEIIFWKYIILQKGR